MKRIKFILTGLLVAMSVTALAQNAIWKDPTNNVEYELNVNNLTASVKAGDALESDVYPAHDGLTGDIVIPEKVRDEFTVVEIGQGAFMENPGITSITIPKTVTYIDRAAFSECTGCTDIYCYANPSKLGWRIFDYYPEGKPDKGTKFHVPAGYLSKYESKFSNANVTFVGDLPDEGESESETIISTFMGWQGEDTSLLNGMMLTEENHDWYMKCPQSGVSASFTTTSFAGGAAEKCIKISGSSGNIKVMLNNMFECEGPVAKIVIRAAGDIGEVNVGITDQTDMSKKENQRVLPQGSGTGFKDITVPFSGSIDYKVLIATLEITGKAPFYLQSITIVQKEAEAATSGKTGDLNWKVEKLDGTVTIRESNGNLVEKPKYRLTISGNGDMPDYDQKRDDATGKYYYDTPWRPFETITELEIEEGVKSIGSNAFGDAHCLNKAKLPSSLRLIGFSAFDGSSILSIDLPEGLETIANYAFAYCYNLKEIKLPASLKNVYGMSFEGNYVKELTVAVDNKTFDSRDNCNAVILTAENRLVLGTATTVIPATVTSIGDYAFGSSRLTSLVIPDAVTAIGKSAFSYSSSMESLVIGRGVTSIDENVFQSTTKLADVLCYANPAALTWTGYDNAKNFMADKATKIHVKAADLVTWQTKFPDINATFVGDLEDSGEVSDGDVDGDGEVTAEDVASIANVIAGLITDEKIKAAADVNGDSKVDVADIVALINKLLGK